MLTSSLPNPSGFHPVLQCLSSIDCFDSSFENSVVDSSLAKTFGIISSYLQSHLAFDFRYQKPLIVRQVHLWILLWSSKPSRKDELYYYSLDRETAKPVNSYSYSSFFGSTNELGYHICLYINPLLYILIAYYKGMVVTKSLGNREKYLVKPCYNCTVYVLLLSKYLYTMLSILKIHKGLNQPFSCGTTCQGLTNSLPWV